MSKMTINLDKSVNHLKTNVDSEKGLEDSFFLLLSLCCAHHHDFIQVDCLVPKFENVCSGMSVFHCQVGLPTVLKMHKDATDN